ncbi:MAG: hypothetical protein ABW217_00390 [Polyangiaceae bacterium]
MNEICGSVASVGAKVACGVAALGAALACSSESDSVYESKVRPIFQERCVLCHYDGPATCPDDNDHIRSLDHPFDASVCGMTTMKNRYAGNGHMGPEYDVVPGDPDNSAIMLKVTDRKLVPENGDPLIYEQGIFMPPKPPPMTDGQIATVEQWIRDGATDSQLFRDSVVPLLGEKDSFPNGFCANGGYADGCILCGRCHYDGAPTYPVLELPPLNVDNADALVAEWLDNLVGAPAQYRPDLQLIVPGDPDASFLVMKMKATSSSTALGAPMPYGYEPLSDAQVETLRTWIAAGARQD